MRELSFDPYATLGIPPRADTRQVRDAYHRLARQHHPDRSDDRRANERMQCINRAWAILSSPARRARHDAESLAAPTASPGHWEGAPRRASRWQPPPRAWSAAPAPTRGHRTWSVRSGDEGVGAWRFVLGALILLLAIGPLVIGALSLPVFGLLVFLTAGLARRD